MAAGGRCWTEPESHGKQRAAACHPSNGASPTSGLSTAAIPSRTRCTRTDAHALTPAPSVAGQFNKRRSPSRRACPPWTVPRTACSNSSSPWERQCCVCGIQSRQLRTQCLRVLDPAFAPRVAYHEGGAAVPRRLRQHITWMGGVTPTVLDSRRATTLAHP